MKNCFVVGDRVKSVFRQRWTGTVIKVLKRVDAGDLLTVRVERSQTGHPMRKPFTHTYAAGWFIPSTYQTKHELAMQLVMLGYVKRDTSFGARSSFTQRTSKLHRISVTIDWKPGEVVYVYYKGRGKDLFPEEVLAHIEGLTNG